MEKTDLKKVLSISGTPGLYHHVAQSRSGVIVEALADGHRTSFGLNAKISSLSDISIYTDADDMSLKDVFLAMKAVLGDDDAPNAKSDPEALKAFFAKAVPTYDRDRFYVSHMKKVVEWYNLIKNHASLEFEEEEKENENAEQPQA